MTIPKTRPIGHKQEHYLRTSTNRVNLCEGSIRSGKSHITSNRFMMKLVTSEDTGAWVIVGRTIDSVWRNVIEPMQDPKLFGDLAKHVKGNFGANRISILGEIVYVLGASDVSSELVLRGLTVQGALVDEATTLHPAFFKQLLGRMSTPNAQMFATTNPDSPAHWLKKDFIDRIGAKVNPIDTWNVYTFFLEDNPSNTQKYINDIKAEYAGQDLWEDRYIKGLWVAADGAVFGFWNEAKYVVPHDELPLMRRIYGVGVDVGSDHPSAAIVLAHGVDNKLYFVNEWEYSRHKAGASLSIWHQAELLKEFMNGELLPTYKDEGLTPDQLARLNADQQALRPEYTVVDSAARDMIVSLEEHGVDNFKASNKEVLEGIRTMTSMFTTGRLKVSDRCTGLIEEMPGYIWDSAKSKLGIEEPKKENDDHIDPARYILMSTQSDWHDLLLYNQ